ncbi:uncharacterized protein N7469_011311 [Penicillium citrinum]|uniref:Uncharacterized protein n=1 Tax=Penicillium citrinum TaxID=5077 RepID=A0A9W9TCP2_PENCI|nr:uncharacterized protein N7469_011311 [Penicillium citrinum]KAJ5217686.1 hypothetical protein N7469_011311 [Penicillium citrinum]
MAAARWSNRGALASQAIVGKRLFSTAKEEVSSTSSDALPVHLRNLAEFSRSAALKSLKKGYMVLAPNTKDTPRFYKL